MSEFMTCAIVLLPQPWRMAKAYILLVQFWGTAPRPQRSGTRTWPCSQYWTLPTAHPVGWRHSCKTKRTLHINRRRNIVRSDEWPTCLRDELRGTHPWNPKTQRNNDSLHKPSHECVCTGHGVRWERGPGYC